MTGNILLCLNNSVLHHWWNSRALKLFLQKLHWLLFVYFSFWPLFNLLLSVWFAFFLSVSIFFFVSLWDLMLFWVLISSWWERNYIFVCLGRHPGLSFLSSLNRWNCRIRIVILCFLFSYFSHRLLLKGDELLLSILLLLLLSLSLYVFICLFDLVSKSWNLLLIKWIFILTNQNLVLLITQSISHLLHLLFQLILHTCFKYNSLL